MSTVSGELDVRDVPVRELNADEGAAMFDERCQAELDVSADDFLAASARGEFPAGWSTRSIARLEMLQPFAA